MFNAFKNIHKNHINFLRYQISERKHYPTIRTEVLSVNFPFNTVRQLFFWSTFSFTVYLLQRKPLFFFPRQVKLNNYCHLKNYFIVGKMLKMFVYNLEILELQDKLSFICSQYYCALKKSWIYLSVIR